MSFTYIVNKFVASILALIVAFVTPAGAVAPSAPARVNRNLPIVQPQEEVEEEVELVEEPTEENPEKGNDEGTPEDGESNMGNPALNTVAGLVGENNEEPAGEPEEPKDEPQEEAQNNGYVAEWNISNTENDDVHMYVTDNEQNFLENFAETVKATFLPITAYAAENEEPIIEDAENKTVIIQGTGATEEMLFLRWLNHNEFAPEYEAWCEREYLGDDEYIDRDYIDEMDGTITGDSITGNEARAKYNYVDAEHRNEVMMNKYVPLHIYEFIEATPNFWTAYARFAPELVIIRGNVDEINFYAFGFCTCVKEVRIESDVEVIRAGAFARTGLTRIDLPESVVFIGDSAFYGCADLATINIRGELIRCDDCAFSDIAENAKIYCNCYNTYKCLIGINNEDYINPTALGEENEAGEEEEVTEAEAEYYGNAKINFDVNYQFNAN